MKGKLVGFDFELNTLTIQFEDLDDFEFSVREVVLNEVVLEDLQKGSSELTPFYIRYMDDALLRSIKDGNYDTRLTESKLHKNKIRIEVLNK